MADIQFAVGKKCKNNTVDVFIVQQLLNKFLVSGRLALAPLTVDGDCGKKTIAAIKTFQAVFLGFREPDGRIDPKGQTLTSLNGDVNQAQKGDPSESTRQAVMTVLKSVPSFSFQLKHLRFDSSDLEEIGRLVAERRVEILYEDSLGENAEYLHEPNCMKLGFQKASTALRRSVIVHESAHAILDKRAQMETVKDSEAFAFIVQATYYYQQNKRHIYEIGYAAVVDVLMHAGNIGIEILARTPISQSHIDSLYAALNQVPGYNNSNVFAYKGI